MRQAPAIGFQFRVSPTLVGATIVVTLLAMAAVWISGLAGWLRNLMLASAGAYGGSVLARTTRPKVKSMLWRSDGCVEIRLRDTKLEDGRDVLGSLQGARVMGALIVLRLRWPPRKRATLWLLPDNLDRHTRRRLRMRLGAEGGGLASGNTDSR